MRRITGLIALTTAAVTVAAGMTMAADQPLAGSATLVAPANLPKVATLPQYVEGGFSGLYPVAGEPGRFWTVSDRGPNGDTFGNPVRRPFPSPAFTPSIYKVSVDITTQQMQIVQRIPLKLSAGNVDPLRATVGGPADQITGFGNIGMSVPGNVPVADEEPVSDSNADGFVNAADLPFAFDPYGLDTEGIVFDPRGAGSFWVVDEYRPSIVHVALDGTLLRRYTPAGQNAANLGPAWSAVPLNDVLPAMYSLRRDNRGFEGVAISPDGTTLYAVVQNPLAIPNATCSAVPGYAGGNNNRSATRIAKVDITNPATPVLVGDFVYTLDVDAAEVAFTDMRISDLFWVGPDRLLVDERDDTGLVRRFVYEADLSAATNVQAPPSGVDVSCIDTLEPSALAARGVVVATKTARLDLASTTGSAAYPFDKLEGLARLASGNLATVNDNDFQTVYDAVTGAFTVSTKPTQYVEYGSAKPATILAIAPASGPTTGGTNTTITGTGLSGSTGVTFGGVAGTGFTVVNDTTITVTTPARPVGAADVIVIDPAGNGTLSAGFTYTAPAGSVPAPSAISTISPSSGTILGGDVVTLRGSGFLGATGVTFDGAPGTFFAVVDDTTITVRTPPGAFGPADVAVADPDGNGTLLGGFIYTPAGELPETGISTNWPLSIATLLVLAGAVSMCMARPRTRVHHSSPR